MNNFYFGAIINLNILEHFRWYSKCKFWQILFFRLPKVTLLNASDAYNFFSWASWFFSDVSSVFLEECINWSWICASCLIFLTVCRVSAKTSDEPVHLAFDFCFDKFVDYGFFDTSKQTFDDVLGEREKSKESISFCF